MSETEDYVQLPADSTGKKMRTETYTIGLNTVEAEVVHIADSLNPTTLVIVTPSGEIRTHDTEAITLIREMFQDMRVENASDRTSWGVRASDAWGEVDQGVWA
jgi:hypothetical protein